jgi:glycosyltransferase involved in cell wall biosynthesis
MNVLHIIIGLGNGGAENMLKRLISFDIKKNGLKNKHSVVSLTNNGAVGEELKKIGVDVMSLNMHSMLQIPQTILTLRRIITKEDNTLIIQTWMYHADLMGGLAAYFSGNRNVVWNIRGSGIPQSLFSATGALVKICASLSNWLPRKIICCADVAKESHIKLGYSKKNMCVISNGYDIDAYNPCINKKNNRLELGFSNKDILIGTVGRFDPLKDYYNFISSAKILLEENKFVKFIMIGNGLTNSNKKLMGWIDSEGLSDNFTLIGEVDCVNKYLSIIDIYCMSSYKEGFPNAICEAMLMKIPCVSTSAGDSTAIISDTGFVVPVKSPVKLSKALLNMINFGDKKRVLLGELARSRIIDKYSIEKILDQYISVYKEIKHEKHR